MKKPYTRPVVAVVMSEPPTLLTSSGPEKKKFNLQVVDRDDDNVEKELKLWEQSVTIHEENPDDID